MRLTIGYSDSEDRVWMRIEGSSANWWLTRRLALALIRQWATLVEKSYTDEGLSMPSPQDDTAATAGRARSAHKAAVASAKPVAPVGRPAPGVETVNRTVSSIDLTVKPNRFDLVFKGAGAQDAVRLSRDEAHRMLAALCDRCRTNGWFNATLPGWLVGDAGAAGSQGSARGTPSPGAGAPPAVAGSPGQTDGPGGDEPSEGKERR